MTDDEVGELFWFLTEVRATAWDEGRLQTMADANYDGTFAASTNPYRTDNEGKTA